MKIVYTGLESSGKSLILARTVCYLAKRNKKWLKKWGFKRLIYSNLKFSPTFYEKNKEFIRYWDDMKDIIGLTGCDILWDEISSDFSALKKEPMSRTINRWLRQGAKQGVHIYATAQEFHDIHLDFRRRCLECINVRKVIGSPRSGQKLPPVHFIWGLIFGFKIDIHPYNELEPKKMGIIPDIIFITPMLCNVFNTHQVIINSDEPPYEHIVKKCFSCSYKRIIHR